MVGNHNSGRKPNPLAGQTRHKKITFYVKEYQDFDGWKVDPIFVWFKRHHGQRWQEKLRNYMYNDVKAWKLHEFWRCECPNKGALGNYVHMHSPKCHRCNVWKNESVRRIHEGERKEQIKKLYEHGNKGGTAGSFKKGWSKDE